VVRNAHAWLGEGRSAVEKVNRAMALSPYDPLVCAFSGGASMAYLADGQYDRAIEFALRCVRENRGYTAAYKLLILGLSLAGRETEARSPLQHLLFLEPAFTVRRYRARFPGRDGPLADPFCNALLRAGTPP
jgi:adenylate cyclase